MTDSPEFNGLKKQLELLKVPSRYLKLTEYGSSDVIPENEWLYSGTFTLEYLGNGEYLDDDKYSFFLFGATGIGKTQLMVDFLATQIEDGTCYGNNTQYFTFPDLLANLRSTKNFDTTFYVGIYGDKIGSIAEFVYYIKRELVHNHKRDVNYGAEYLFFDDLQLENLTSEDKQNLTLIINACYESERQIFITSNHNIKEVAEVLGVRISSRIVEMSNIFKMTGESRRLQKPYVREKQ